MLWHMFGVKMIVPLSCAALGGCGPSALEGGFDSANPAAKLYAIEQAARHHDRSAVGQIIEQLDSDDPAVRLVAIAALQRLTGRTYDYRDYDPPQQRRQAIDRWKAALQSGELSAEEPPVTPRREITETNDHE